MDSFWQLNNLILGVVVVKCYIYLSLFLSKIHFLMPPGTIGKNVHQWKVCISGLQQAGAHRVPGLQVVALLPGPDI